MSKANHTDWYTNIFKSWQVKLLGPKPTAEMLATIHGLGAKAGKQALASAMGLRERGVTNPQIILACGNPQLNKMRGFITDALLKREPVAPSSEGHTVYKLVITPKGLQRVKSYEARQAKLEAEQQGVAKPAKVSAKRAVKAARKVKAKAATEAKADATPTSDAPVTAEMVTDSGRTAEMQAE